MPSEFERKAQMLQAAEAAEEEPEQAGRAAGVGGRLDHHCFKDTLHRAKCRGSSTP